MHIYQVGGAVRDKLLHRTNHDKDYVVIGAKEEEMLALGYKKVGKSFPVFLHPETNEEYALARKEIKIGPGHCGFQFIFTPDITLEEDAIRRDFTCNALYEDITTGELIDFHHGKEDIANHILRHVSEHFVEDPLRVLRMCRFSAQLDFSVAPETMDICIQMVKQGDLQQLSRVRIWQELEKALICPNFFRFIETARACGALEAILPEIETLWRVPERKDYHPEGNSGEHTLLALKAAASRDRFVNFAVLMHDVGKIKTDKSLWPSHHGHAELGADIVKSICRRLHIPQAYKDFTAFTCTNHMLYHAPITENVSKLAEVAVKLAKNKQEQWLPRLLAVMKADMLGRKKDDFSQELQQFAVFAAYLERLTSAAQKIKMTDMPEFSSIQEKIEKGECPPSSLKQVYLTRLIKENPPA